MRELDKITITCSCGKSFKSRDRLDFHYEFAVGRHKCPYCGYSGKLRNPLAIFDD